MEIMHPLEVKNQEAVEPLKITKEANFAGMVERDIIVCAGGTLSLFGTLSKDLTVQPGGKAMVFGTVIGDVWNWGGDLEIYGTVQGRLVRQAGKTLMGRDSRVGR